MDKDLNLKSLLLMQAGLRLFNQKCFWECHEALEDLWYEDQRAPQSQVYWAIIQAATALYHYENKNIVGARGMINKAKAKVKEVMLLGVDHSFLDTNLGWCEFCSILENISESPVLEEFESLCEFNFPLLPKGKK